MNQFGVSFSIKYARELGIDPRACLEAALKDLGVRRLRLMSYWDVHEPSQGKYDFNELDWQFRLAKKYNAAVSLAIGLRQPRWPESHWPEWAEGLDKQDWEARLLTYIGTVVERYKDHPSLESWQLENEAMLKTFGLKGNFDRQRLINEFNLVKRLDTLHPVIMSTSDSWGIPLRKPRPDVFGISLYRRFYDRGKYRRSLRPTIFNKFRTAIIKAITGRPVFIHELQTEPWGNRATINLPLAEQNKTMTANFFIETIRFATKTGLLPAYLWGVEWWYWLKLIQNDDKMWQAAKNVYLSIDQH